jgi:hypothetical protein
MVNVWPVFMSVESSHSDGPIHLMQFHVEGELGRNLGFGAHSGCFVRF